MGHTKLNVNGGAVALGHPIGASGGKLGVSVIHDMERRGARHVLAAPCVGSDMGIALCPERGSNDIKSD